MEVVFRPTTYGNNEEIKNVIAIFGSFLKKSGIRSFISLENEICRKRKSKVFPSGLNLSHLILRW